MGKTILDDSLKKGPISWMAQNSVAANLIMFVCILGGIFMTMNIKKEVFPEFSTDMVSVSVPYPGASPEEVEKSIVQVIEENVRGLDGVKEVTSTASEGVGTVMIEMLVGYDLQKLSQDVKTEIDRIVTFPEDAEEPQVTQTSRKRQVISLIIAGDIGETALREVAEQVRDRMLVDDDITQVEVSGNREYEISIEIPQDNLRRYNLTLQQVASKVSQTSLEVPGGSLKTVGGEILVRMKERRDWGEDFENIPILSLPDGSELLLKDIASVRDDFEDIDKFTTYNGKRALMLDIYRIGKETPTQVAGAAKKIMEEMEETLPDGIEMAVWRDMSLIYEQRMDLLLRNGAVGLVLVLFLLSFFLEIKLAFWVMLGIPISFLGSMMILPACDVSISMISMFGFLIALGIVVDDAIVVGENVYHYHQEGMPFMKAAILGAREVAIPVTFSVLTNIMAFLPMLFVPGFMGKIFRVFPFIIAAIFFLSLVESLFVLPAHLGHQSDKKKTNFFARWQRAFSDGFVNFIRKYYGPFLDMVLRNRYITILIGIAILSITFAYIHLGYISFIQMPRIESDYSVATIVMPYGCDVSETIAVKDLLEKKAHEVIEANGGDELAEGVIAMVNTSASSGGPGGTGTSGSHIAKVYITLTEPEKRPISTTQLTDLWRSAVGDVPGTEYVRFEADSGGPGSGAALSVELSHKSMAVLEDASAELADDLREIASVYDVDDGFTPGKEQLDFKIKSQGEVLGFTVSDIARQLRNSYYGAEAIRQQRGRNELKIMVRLPESERDTMYSLENMMVRSPKTGVEVPLREVASVERGRAYTSISRRNGRRVITVTSNNPPENTTIVLHKVRNDVLPPLMAKYNGLQAGFEGRQADMRESNEALMAGFVVALLGIYAMLAIPFRSYVQPLIIMTSIPFGMVGAVVGHVMMGYNLSMISIFGIVALAGVVVNDVLVLVDFANQKKAEGMNSHDAILAAGVQRFRPIMLTTLTTFGGLAPMIFETSRQARFLIPMALSLGYGIIFATAITLVLAPSLYMMIEDAQYFGKKVKQLWQSI